MTTNDDNFLNPSFETNLLNPSQIINQMIELKVQLAQLQQQIQALEPQFKAACLALNTEKITLHQAIISRRLTPGKWLYSPDILTREHELKQLKRQFQQTHEPHSGREVFWAIKLLSTSADTTPSP